MSQEKDFEFVANIATIDVDSNVKELKEFIASVRESYIETPVTYENRVQAKESLAALRKLRSDITKKVNGLKKDVLGPWEKFRADVDEACIPIDGLITSLSSSLDAVEQQRIKEKEAHVKLFVADYLNDVPESIREVMKDYWEDRWLNATTSDNSIAQGLDNIINQTASTLEAINGTKYEAQLLSVFKQHWSYLDVIKMKSNLERQDAELERVKAASQKSDAAKMQQAEVPQSLQYQDALKPQQEVTQPQIQPKAGDLVLSCEALLVGTKEQIQEAVRLFRTTGAKIVKLNQYQPATEHDLEISKYGR